MAKARVHGASKNKKLDKAIEEAEEAKILEETPNPPAEEEENEEVENEEGQSSERISIEGLQEEAKEKAIVVDFMADDYSSAVISKQTKKSDNVAEEKTESKFEGKTIDEVKAEIASTEANKSGNLKAKDLEDISKMIINIIDLVMSGILKWWAKDTSDTAYSLNEKKKEAVVNQLTLILIKHQTKWSIELMFILTLLAIYGPMFMIANKNRKNPVKRTQGKPTKK